MDGVGGLPGFLRVVQQAARSNSSGGASHANERKEPATGPQSDTNPLFGSRPDPDRIKEALQTLRVLFPEWEDEPLLTLFEANAVSNAIRQPGYHLEPTVDAILEMSHIDYIQKTFLQHQDEGQEEKQEVIMDNAHLEEQHEENEDEEHDETDQDEEERKGRSSTGSSMEGSEKEDEGGQSIDYAKGQLSEDHNQENIADSDSLHAGTSADAEARGDERPHSFLFSDIDSPPVADDQRAEKEVRRSLIAEVMKLKKAESAQGESQIGLAQRYQLDISNAWKELEQKSYYPVFEYLTRASKLYQEGLLSSSELDMLRSMLLSGSELSKDRRGRAKNMDCLMKETDWEVLVLKAKVKLVDLETHSSWLIRRRLKEFKKLSKKLTQVGHGALKKEYSELKNQLSKEDAGELIRELEAFLRSLAALATLPLSAGRAQLLREFQRFVDVTSRVRSLQSIQLSEAERVRNAVEVHVFRILNQVGSEEHSFLQHFLSSVRPDQSEAFLKRVAQVMDRVQDHLLRSKLEGLVFHYNRLTEPPSPDDIHQQISDVVRYQVEETIFMPLSVNIRSAVRRVRQRDYDFIKKATALQSQPQSFFGIDILYISVSGWEKAASALKKLDNLDLPCDMVQCLCSVGRIIYETHQQEHALLESAPEEPGQVVVISGDSLLPIFIYVLIQARLTHPLTTLELMVTFCDHDSRVGERGYFLATYEAAIRHIELSL